MARKKRNPATGQMIEPKAAKKPSAAELAKQDAKNALGPTTGFLGAVEADPDCKEYVEICVAEIKSGRSNMTIAEIYAGLRKHFNYPKGYATVRDYVAKKHGRQRDW